jgi:flavin reductase (DIM6/NTAB) family NADH-FMN oxidoreductase RutF
MTIIIEQISTIDPTRVRDVMSKVPTSVTVVAGQPELTGERTAMTVGSFMFVSLEPCLIGFFVGRESTSWPQINKSTVLGISTLASGQAGFCRKLGKKEADRFADHYWTRGEYGAPLVAGSGASMECQIENITSVGDHDFVLARVLDISPGTTADPLGLPKSRIFGTQHPLTARHSDHRPGQAPGVSALRKESRLEPLPVQ